MNSIISTSRNGNFKVISKRIPMLDYARLLTAFLVIYGHLFPYEPNNYVRVFIYQFHMPLFFMLSGYLMYAKSVDWKCGGGKLFDKKEQNFAMAFYPL